MAGQSREMVPAEIADPAWSGKAGFRVNTLNVSDFPGSFSRFAGSWAALRP